VIRQKKMRLPLAICLAMIAGFTVQNLGILLIIFLPPRVPSTFFLVQCMRQLGIGAEAVA